MKLDQIVCHNPPVGQHGPMENHFIYEIHRLIHGCFSIPIGAMGLVYLLFIWLIYIVN